VSPGPAVRHQDGDGGFDGVVPRHYIHGARTRALEIGEFGAVGECFVISRTRSLVRIGSRAKNSRSQAANSSRVWEAVCAVADMPTRSKRSALATVRGLHRIDHDSSCLPRRSTAKRV